MRWSPSQDYNEAVQHPASAFADPDLAAGAAAVNALDLPAPCSGNFAGVYRLDGPAGRWAVKCFTRPAAGRAQRYAAVARHLAAHPLPFLVGFRFLGQGIRVAGRWYPAVKMDWVEGPTLAAFVEAHLDRPDALLALAGLWRRLVGRLAAAGVAHGDLQHGNVLLVPGDRPGAAAVKLVDYDGMCAPGLEATPAGEAGHPAYQHPARAGGVGYGPDMDRFPALTIYTALRALAVGGRALWDRFDTGDNLLFTRAAPAFAAIAGLPDPEVRLLVSALSAAAQGPIDRVPSLETVLAGQTAAPVPRPAASPPFARLATPPASVVAANEPESVEALFAATAAAESTSARRRTGPRWRRRAAVIAGLAVIATAMPIVAARFPHSSPPEPRPAAPAGPGPPAATAAARPLGTADVRPRATPDRSPGPDPKPVPTPGPGKPPAGGPPPAAREAARPARVLRGHTDWVRAVAISGDGRRAVSGGPDKTLRVWDLDTGEAAGVLAGNDQGVYAVAVAADGRRALAGGGEGERRGDNAVRLFDLDAGTEVLRLRGHEHCANCVAFLPDGRRAVTGSLDGSVRLWDLADGREVRRLDTWKREPGEFAQVWSLAVCPDGKRVLCGLRSDVAYLVDVETARVAHSFRGRKSSFVSVAISPDGTRALAASDGKEGSDVAVYLWDLAAGAVLRRFDQLPGAVHAVAFLPGGRRAAFGLHHEPGVAVWDLDRGRALSVLKGPVTPVAAVAVSADGSVVAGEDGGTVSVWRLPPE